MKRIISLLLVFCMTLVIFPQIMIADEQQPLIHYYGDVNFDDMLNTNDAAIILRYAAGMTEFSESAELALTHEGISKADANKDGSVNTADAAFVLRVSADMTEPNTYTDEIPLQPTAAPTQEPTNEPTQEPTEAPTNEPTQEPTQAPTNEPTQEPTQAPTQEPTPYIWNGEDVSTTLDGSGTDADPFQIKTAADIAFMAKNIKGQCKGVDMVSASYRVVNDIYFNAEGMLDENYDLAYEPNRFGGIGIGTDESTWFSGKFNGNNKTIYGLYIFNQMYNGTISGLAVGFFAGMKSSACIHDLSFADSYVEGSRKNVADNKNAYIGGITGVLVVNQSSMTSASENMRNVSFDGRVKCSGVTSQRNTTGGIAGIITASQNFHKGRIDNCTMSGLISVSQSGITYASGMHYLKDAGGIGGIAGGVGETRCNIMGMTENIQSFATDYTMPANTTFKNCVNNSTIRIDKITATDATGAHSATDAAGGIVGRIHGAERPVEDGAAYSVFEQCANYGDIEIPTAYSADGTKEVKRMICAGGIAGTSFSRAAKFTRCVNDAVITSGNCNFAAGIIANRVANTFKEEYVFEYCYSRGEIRMTSTQSAHINRAGIAGVGFYPSTAYKPPVRFTSCYCGVNFSADTVSETKSLGIMWAGIGTAPTLTETNCFYLMSIIPSGYTATDIDAVNLTGVSAEDGELVQKLNNGTANYVFADGILKLAWEA